MKLQDIDESSSFQVRNFFLFPAPVRDDEAGSNLLEAGGDLSAKNERRPNKNRLASTGRRRRLTRASLPLKIMKAPHHTKMT